MSSESLLPRLAELRKLADTVRNGFPTTQWQRIAGGGPDSLELAGGGQFAGLVIERTKPLHLRSQLHIPAEAHHVSLVGQPMEATLFALYPLTIHHRGRAVFEETGVPVAAGPALFTIVPELVVGDNGPVDLIIQGPDHQAASWFNMWVTTPTLRMRAEKLDVLWSQLALAEAVAKSPAQRQAVRGVCPVLDQILLAQTDEQLHAITERLIKQLSPVADDIAKLNVHLIGHSHIDMNWLWTWPDTVQTILRDVRSVLQLMDDYPALTFSHSQPATYEVVRENEPQLFAKILEHIRAGRWEATTMQWVEGDVNMASGEAQVRQLLEGVSYTRNVLGTSPVIFHAPDTFGHAGNIPQLAASAGAKAYYHHRCNPGHINQWPAYWWHGQDGSRVLGISTPAYNGDITAGAIALAAIRAYRAGLPCGTHFHGIGDHGGGPARQNLDALARLQNQPLLPVARCSTMHAYIDQVLAHSTHLPVHHGETRTIFEGCYTTHADTKWYNRQGENLLCTADALTAMAGFNHPPAVTQAWRTVLFNQFHDIFDGSAIHESYERNKTDFQAVERTAGDAIDRALRVLQSHAEPGTIAVTNPLGFGRDEWVTIPACSGTGAVLLESDTGHKTVGQYTADGLGFVAHVGAWATAMYRIVTDASPEALPPAMQPTPAFAPADSRLVDNLFGGQAQAPYFCVKTPHFTAYVRRDCGVIVSLFDHRCDRELVAYGLRRPSDYVDTARPDLALNVLQLLDELPHGMSSWQVHEVHNEQSLIRGAQTTILETGPARCVLQVVHTVRQSTITQKIIFYRDLPRIDFDTSIDWREIGDKTAGVPNLKVAFTARLNQCQAWFETPFAAVQRPSDGQEVPALRWADVGGDDYGIALLNNSKYGYDAMGCRLRMTLVRSAYEPDAVSDIGHHRVQYSLLPHVGHWTQAGVVHAAAGFNQPLLARLATTPITCCKPPMLPVLQHKPTNIIIGGLKPAHDGRGFIARLYDSTGHAGQVTLINLPPSSVIEETNILEQPIAALQTQDRCLTLAFRPWQVRSLRIVPVS